MVDVALDMRLRLKGDAQAADRSDDMAAHHHVLGDHGAGDLRLVAKHERAALDIALDLPVDLDLALGRDIADDRQVLADDRRHELAGAGALGVGEGTVAELNALGLAVRKEWFFSGDFSIESGGRAARQWMALEDRPSAVFCASDQMAFGFISELHSNRLHVPEAVSVVGFDDLYLSKAFYPPLTTVSQPRADIGRTAMSQLLNVLSDDDIGAEPAIVLPTTLNIRGSTAPPRK